MEKPQIGEWVNKPGEDKSTECFTGMSVNSLKIFSSLYNDGSSTSSTVRGENKKLNIF